MELIDCLRHDTELIQLRKEWKLKFTESFPVFNFDEFYGIDDYKQCIKKGLKSGDYKQVYRKITKFDSLQEQIAKLEQLKREWKLKFVEDFPKFDIRKYKNYNDYVQEIKEYLNSK